ncbi:MAG TPA: hypothetical protein VFZ33_20620 [Chitinophagaceae bacterium]
MGNCLELLFDEYLKIIQDRRPTPLNSAFSFYIFVVKIIAAMRCGILLIIKINQHEKSFIFFDFDFADMLIEGANRSYRATLVAEIPSEQNS